MAADSGLKQNEIVRIARGKRQVVGLFKSYGTAGADARGVYDGRAAGDFDGRGYGADAKLAVDCGLGSGIQHHAGVALRVESIFADGHGVRAERQIGEDMVSIILGLSRTGRGPFRRSRR